MFADTDLTDDLFLCGKVKLLQPKDGYRAGTDPVLLAAACPAKPNQRVLELGCGAGAALLCLNARVPIHAFGVERLGQYAELATRNAQRNNAPAEIVTADLDNLPASLREKVFDHVIINPPFFRDGRKAENIGRATGRQEDTPLENWIDQALRRIKPKGYITLIHLTERLSEIIFLLKSRAGDIEIKPLVAREGKLPKRIIVRARKGAMGGSTLYNALVLHEGVTHEVDQDSFSIEAKRILREGQSLLF